MQKTKTIAVIGAGLMGAGIVQVFAVKGFRTKVYDPIVESLDTLHERISQNLALMQAPLDCLKNITACKILNDAVADADFIFEAAPEKLAIKRSIFSDLLPLVKDDAILASNTSVIPIRDIGEGLEHGGRLVGTHWWNPPYLIPLVEVVQSEKTSLESVEKTIELLEIAGKKPIHVKKDVTGFVANRMQHALWREAIALVNDGVCDAETIDIAVKNSFGLRLPVLGPIENADLVGLDLTQDIHNVVLADLNKDTVPAKVLSDKIANGELGMKTNQGLRSWTPEQAENVKKNLIQYLLTVTENPFPHSDN
jgi:3-hydroxybutyryl-CoA dehydrogenase